MFQDVPPEGSAVSKIETARQAVRDHPEMTSRAIAQMLGVSHMTVVRARNMADVPPDVPDVPDVPLDRALAVVLAAAESGELDRADVARIAAARWGLADGDRLYYDGGQLYREAAPRARAGRRVKVRAD
jgi:hypothetical protein